MVISHSLALIQFPPVFPINRWIIDVEENWHCVCVSQKSDISCRLKVNVVMLFQCLHGSQTSESVVMLSQCLHGSQTSESVVMLSQCLHGSLTSEIVLVLSQYLHDSLTTTNLCWISSTRNFYISKNSKSFTYLPDYKRSVVWDDRHQDERSFVWQCPRVRSYPWVGKIWHCSQTTWP